MKNEMDCPSKASGSNDSQRQDPGVSMQNELSFPVSAHPTYEILQKGNSRVH